MAGQCKLDAINQFCIDYAKILKKPSMQFTNEEFAKICTFFDDYIHRYYPQSANIQYDFIIGTRQNVISYCLRKTFGLYTYYVPMGYIEKCSAEMRRLFFEDNLGYFLFNKDHIWYCSPTTQFELSSKNGAIIVCKSANMPRLVKWMIGRIIEYLGGDTQSLVRGLPETYEPLSSRIKNIITKSYAEKNLLGELETLIGITIDMIDTQPSKCTLIAPQIVIPIEVLIKKIIVKHYYKYLPLFEKDYNDISVSLKHVPKILIGLFSIN